DTLELLRRGWRVLAIEGQEEAVERIVELAGSDATRLETRVARYEDVDWPPRDLVNASYALPFSPPARVPPVWKRVVGSLRPGGRFSGQIFGERDEWARAGIVVKTRAEVEAMLEPFEVERLQEFEGEATTTTGKSKYWHLFHIVARKR